MTKEFIQEYFNADFKGIDSLLNDVLVPIFGDYEDGWTEITSDLPSKEKAAQANIKRIKHAATLWAAGRTIRVFDVTLFDNCHIHTSRKNIQTLIRQYVGHFQGALIAFHYENPTDRSWRLSYLEKQDSNVNSTSAKRYTYLCGKDYPCRTIAERFAILAGQDKTDMNLEAAFSVEALSDEFFTGYREIYKDLCKYITDNRNNADLFGEEFATCDEKFIRDYVKKMMGRITFLHFLQRKGWLGQPRNIKGWGKGDLNFMHNLFDKASDEQKDNFLDDVLEPIFFECLNEKREDDFFDTRVSGIRLVKIPYLNGGLFEKDKIDEPRSKFPAEKFRRLFDFFGQYNFTIDESDPLDQEVGVDPEMLGKIFENLLEDNKDKGAFYTPKEIVQYMCREALVAYLVDEARAKSEVNKQRQENFEDAIRALVADPDLTVQRMKRYGDTQLKDLRQSLMDVKICDPAIGSGAFPMGLLNILFSCRMALNDALGEGVPRALLKKDIIRNNIYGVDIEKGAIDIARLRFWLSIVVDLEEPEPLPNFDYKFMQGNSLLEQYKGVDLSTLIQRKSKQNEAMQISMFEDQLDVLRLQLRKYLDEYFITTDHDAKNRLRKDIKENVKQQLQEQHICVDFPEEYDISANTDFFLWHTWFADVFNRLGKQGFDIVIGNPPYGAKLSASEKALYKQLYSEVHMRTPETFCYFTALAFRLCSKGGNGVVSYIVPNNIFFQNENEKTRELLSLENMLLRAINLGDNTFESADVPTCIFVAKAKKSDDYSIEYSDYRKFNIKHIDWSKTIEKINIKKLQTVPSLVLGLSNTNIDILNEIRENGVSIDSIAEEMASGISTGDNNVFIVSQEKQEDYKIESVLLKKILIGSDIDRYSLCPTENRIIYTTRDIDIHQYPYAESYLNGYLSKLSTRSECKSGVLPWFALGRSRYEGLFVEPKIIMRQTSDNIRCVYDDNGFYVLNSILVFKKSTKDYDYKYIASILNSKISNYLYRNLTQEEGRTFAEVKPANVRKLYIPRATNKEQDLLSILYDYMVYLRNCDSPLVDEIISNKFIGDYFERIIDGCAFELFFREHMKERGIDIMDDLYKMIQPLDSAKDVAGTISSVFDAIYKTDNNVRTRLELFVSRSPEYLKVIIQS